MVCELIMCFFFKDTLQTYHEQKNVICTYSDWSDDDNIERGAPERLSLSCLTVSSRRRR